jgi:hypothetical protein
MKLLAGLSLGAFVFVAAPGAQEGPVSPPRRDTAIEQLVNDAGSLPPEFNADVLIRLSQLPNVDKVWRREMLEEAFMRAYGAPEPYRRATTTQVPPDSRQGALVFAYPTALSRVTLQVRVVELMALVDARHARELFEWIELNLPIGSCSDPLVPAVDEYYSALLEIAGRAYGRLSFASLNFFELYLWRAHLPSEMPAVAKAIQGFPRGKDQAEYLEGVLRQILLGNSNDAAGFSSAAMDIVSRTADLQIADNALGVTGSNAMYALREYLLAELKKPRCADNVSAVNAPSTFNAALRRARGEDDVAPINANTLPAPTMLGSARIDLYWQTGEAARLHDAAVRLHGPGVAPFPLRVRQTQEWRNQAERLLNDVDQWSGKSEREERDYFYQKAVLYTWLADLVPAGTLHSQTLRAFVEFLRRMETDASRRMLWFAFLNRLLEMTHGPFRNDVLTAMEYSHQPTIVLYGKMERMAPERRP